MVNPPFAPLTCHKDGGHPLIRGYMTDNTKAFKEIIDYLNQKTGKKFRVANNGNRRLIAGRLAEGYTIEDFKTVIDKKVLKWKDNPRMRDYLRPETLFRPCHFDSYLNESEQYNNPEQEWTEK